MPRSLVLQIAAALLFTSPGFVLAGEFPQPVDHPQGLLTRPHGIECSIADGRLIAKILRYGQGNVAVQSAAADGTAIGHRLEVSCDEAHVRLCYEVQRATGNCVLRVVDERDWQIIHYIEARDETVTLQQPATGPITLTIENKLGRQKFTRRTVWHLLLGQSRMCEEAILELLHEVQPQWDVNQTLQSVRSTLLETADVNLPALDWQKHVANLSADDFSVRQDADHALRAVGRPILHYLASLNPAEFDAEQRLRIRHIRRDLATEEHDTPEAAAALVSNDVGVWLNLLETDEPEKQQRALAQAEQLLGRLPDINLHAKTAELRVQIDNAKARYADAQLTTFR